MDLFHHFFLILSHKKYILNKEKLIKFYIKKEVKVFLTNMMVQIHWFKCPPIKGKTDKYWRYF